MTQKFIYVESSALKSCGNLSEFHANHRAERIALRFSMVTREVTLFPLRSGGSKFPDPGGCVSYDEVRMVQREEHEPNTTSLMSGLEESRPTACIYAFNVCNI